MANYKNRETVYISGKITGDENYRTKFAKAAARLRDLNYEVLNPAVLPRGLTRRQYVPIDLQMLCAADTVAFLSDYRESEGARIEHDIARYLNKQTLYFDAGEEAAPE